MSSDLGVVATKVRAATLATWGEEHWLAMEQIINHESHFNPDAINPTSGACGIFQALPCSKMGGMEVDNQISWGVAYIKSRYGDPIKAWDFWQAHNWY